MLIVEVGLVLLSVLAAVTTVTVSAGGATLKANVLLLVCCAWSLTVTT